MGCTPEVGFPMIGCCGGVTENTYWGLRLVFGIEEPSFLGPGDPWWNGVPTTQQFWAKVNSYAAIMKAYLDALPPLSGFSRYPITPNFIIAKGFDPGINDFDESKTYPYRGAGYACPPVVPPNHNFAGGTTSGALMTFDFFGIYGPIIEVQRVDFSLVNPSPICKVTMRGEAPASHGAQDPDIMCGFFSEFAPTVLENCSLIAPLKDYSIPVPELVQDINATQSIARINTIIFPPGGQFCCNFAP